MKKITMIALTMALSLSLAACSNSASSQSAVPESQTPAGSSASGMDAEETTTLYYGKISGMVGNQMTLAVANAPDFGDLEGETYDGPVIADSEDAEKYGLPGEDYDGPLAQMLPDDTAADVIYDEDTIAEQQLELEYTGEEKDFTIPAGASVLNYMGQPSTSDALRKGLIVQLEVNKDTGIVTSVFIWSQS